MVALAEVVSTADLAETVGAAAAGAAALSVALVGEAVAGDGADRLSRH
jgi:hypothetical protein